MDPFIFRFESELVFESIPKMGFFSEQSKPRDLISFVVQLRRFVRGNGNLVAMLIFGTRVVSMALFSKVCQVRLPELK
jgi:hypothetical protein